LSEFFGLLTQRRGLRLHEVGLNLHHIHHVLSVDKLLREFERDSACRGDSC
jgi:hypothetical protein